MMQHRKQRSLAFAVSIGVVAGALAWGAQAATTQPQVRATSLERVQPEAPWTHERPAECAACRMATQSGSALNNQAVQLESRRLDNGVALRFTSPDAGIRDQLWKATLLRGEMVEALRSGSQVSLCAPCKVRRDALTDLQIAAQRIPEGVVVVYTSARPEVVRDLMHLLEEANPTVRF